MTPNLEILHRFFEITGALAVATGGMAWWRKGSAEEDQVVSTANDTVLDALSDADTVSKIDCLTNRNLREQLTVGEAIEMDKERQLRRFPNRN
jgi:hypothetical protein